MSLNGIFEDGVWARGFDNAPSASSLFTIDPVGIPDNSVTPYGLGYSWKITGSNAPGVNFNVNLTTVIVSLKLFITAPSTNGVLYQFWDATAGATQCSLRVYSDGHVQFVAGSGTTTIGGASAAGLVNFGAFNRIYAKVTINNSTGSVECKVNGTSAISSTGLDTQATANAWVSGFFFQGVSGGNAWFDDWYMLDMTGSSPLNADLGDISVQGDKPSANSATGGRNAYTPTNPQNDNHLNVGNIPANAAQYNADQTPGDFDMFRFPALPAGSTVFWVQYAALVGLDSAGSRTIKMNCNSGGTDSLGPAVTPPPVASAAYATKAYVKDPNTSSAWGLTAAGSAEGGLKTDT